MERELGKIEAKLDSLERKVGNRLSDEELKKIGDHVFSRTYGRLKAKLEQKGLARTIVRKGKKETEFGKKEGKLAKICRYTGNLARAAILGLAAIGALELAQPQFYTQIKKDLGIETAQTVSVTENYTIQGADRTYIQEQLAELTERIEEKYEREMEELRTGIEQSNTEQTGAIQTLHSETDIELQTLREQMNRENEEYTGRLDAITETINNIPESINNNTTRIQELQEELARELTQMYREIETSPDLEERLERIEQTTQEIERLIEESEYTVRIDLTFNVEERAAGLVEGYLQALETQRGSLTDAEKAYELSQIAGYNDTIRANSTLRSAIRRLEYDRENPVEVEEPTTGRAEYHFEAEYTLMPGTLPMIELDISDTEEQAQLYKTLAEKDVNGDRRITMQELQ